MRKINDSYNSRVLIHHYSEESAADKDWDWDCDYEDKINGFNNFRVPIHHYSEKSAADKNWDWKDDNDNWDSDALGQPSTALNNTESKYTSISEWNLDDELKEETSTTLNNAESKHTSIFDYAMREYLKPSYASKYQFRCKYEDEVDSDIQMAILLSQAQADADDHEDDALRQAILLSMETSNSDNDCSSSSVYPKSDLADLISPNSINPNSGDLKLKGVYRPPEMKPCNVQLSACTVCSDEQPTGNMTRLSEKCGHLCCKDCVGDYLSRAIKENIQEPRCPGTKCAEILPWLRCCEHLPGKVVERRYKALEEAKALKNLAIESLYSEGHRRYAMEQRRHNAWFLLVTQDDDGCDNWEFLV